MFATYCAGVQVAHQTTSNQASMAYSPYGDQTCYCSIPGHLAMKHGDFKDDLEDAWQEAMVEAFQKMAAP